jgi:probable rRNA maturation factor
MLTTATRRPGASRVSVEVQFVAGQPAALNETGIVDIAQAVMRKMGENPESVDACIRVVGEEESRTLNEAYRRQNRPTNVLSFPADVTLPAAGETEGTRILGDIVICDPVVRREAQTQNKSVHDHYAHMVVHGMLHLYGHDHLDPGEADVMEDLEREILGGFGIADPYAAD